MLRKYIIKLLTYLIMLHKYIFSFILILPKLLFIYHNHNININLF